MPLFLFASLPPSLSLSLSLSPFLSPSLSPWATGPQHTWAHHHPIKTCVVENGYRHVLNPQFKLIDRTECNRIGRSLDLETERNKQYYPLDNILFYVQMPFLQEQIMSRKFHFVVTDLAVHLNNDFVKLIMGKLPLSPSLPLPLCPSPPSHPHSSP